MSRLIIRILERNETSTNDVGAALAGVLGVTSLIGIGATVLNGAKIGRNCLVGAHALVGEGKEIPDNSMVLGMPGKVVRELGEENENMMLESANIYVQNWKRFKETLKEI